MRRLLPDQGETSVRELIDGFDPVGAAGSERPYVFTNFALTVDGKATLDGVSGPIGSDTDTDMLVALRTVPDAVMIGSGTMRAERYGRPVSDPAKRERRRQRGLEPDPLMVIVAGALDRLPWDASLFTAGEGRVLIVTADGATPPQTETPVEVERTAGEDGRVDLTAALRHLRERRGVRALLCEGGPALHTALLEAGLLDEIFLTWAPAVGGGAGPGLFTGLAEERRELELRWLAAEGGELFARYAVRDAVR